MELEQIYADLYTIAGEIGTLEDAVRSAKRILSLPRYANRDDRYALLAKDIEKAIDAIPEVMASEREGKEGTEQADKGLRQYARWYFSLDQSGTTLSYRRSRGVNPGGTGRKWMNRAVVFSVIAALFDIWTHPVAVDFPHDQPDVIPFIGYQIDWIELKGYAETAGQYLRFLGEDYVLRFLTPSVHLVVTDMPYSGTTLSAYLDRHAIEEPVFQLVPIQKGARAAVLVDTQNLPLATPLRMNLSYGDPSRPCQDGPIPRLHFKAEHPTKLLMMRLDIRLPFPDHIWRLTKQSSLDDSIKVIEEHDCSSLAIIKQPELGSTYALTLTRHNSNPMDNPVADTN